MLVCFGDCIFVDGEIIEGISGIDESLVIGESVLCSKGFDEVVFVGLINVEVVLCICVMCCVVDNIIVCIIWLVEEVEEVCVFIEWFIDCFSCYYMFVIVVVVVLVIFVLLLLLGGDWGMWIYCGLVFLLIGCFCVLVILVLVLIVLVLFFGVKWGLLMKGGVVIEVMVKLCYVVFDKIGMLIYGRLVVIDIVFVIGILVL